MYSQDLYHHGTKGQKWRIRKYQNPDGSLTPEGKRRYGYGSKSNSVRSNAGHRKFANDALKTETKLNKQYDKALKKNDADKIKKAKNDIKSFNVDKNKAAKLLDMSAKEISYRDAEAQYNRRLRRAAVTGGVIAGPFGAALGAIGSQMTATGSSYVEAYKNAYADYQKEQKRKVVSVI